MEQSFYNLLHQSISSMQKKQLSATIDPEVWQEFCAKKAVVAPKIAPKVVPTAPVDPVVQTLAEASLNDLSKCIASCQLCKLGLTRRNSVAGGGAERAELMFISEAPRAAEDMQGRPLVGEEGELVEKMIVAMKYSRDDIFITNVVKCRPPNNREPQPEEAMACRPYLLRQIELVQPKAIVCFGKAALALLLNIEVNISQMRGKWVEFNGIPVMPTFHPGYLLRQVAAKRDTWNDLKEVMKFLEKQ